MEKSFEQSRSTFISKTMSLMGLGLLVTFITAFIISRSDVLFTLVAGSRFNVIILALIEIGIVFYLTSRIGEMSVSSAKMWFMVYSVVNGLTFSVFFMAYTLSSIYVVFLTASVMFIVFGLIGINVRKDLSGIGSFLIMGVIGLLAASIINMFLNLPGLYFMISVIGVLIFCGLTAYDMQKVKNIHYEAYSYSQEVVDKYTVVAALTLYLDFINIFIYLLRILGKRR